jgi:excisionase family DNA binding protein
MTPAVVPGRARVYLTVAEVADELAVPVGKLLLWIKSSELRAVNVAVKAGRKPRWRISALDLETFLRSRSVVPGTAPRRRRRAVDPEVIKFF